MRRITLLAWFTATLACIAWAGALYAAWSLAGARATYVQEKADMEQLAGRDAASVRLHALLEQTTSQRALFDELVRVDILQAFDFIEDTGRIAGVALKVGNATSLPKKEGAPPGSLNEVAIVISADGSFQDLVHAEALLETLPFPSKVEEVEWDRTASGSASRGDTWHLTAKLRLLTSADIPL